MAMRTSIHMLWLTGLFLCCGCLSQQVANDGRGMRNALIDLYTDQAIDNLMRAHSGLPFVQLSYNSLGVNDTDQVTVAAAGGDAAFGGSHTTDPSKGPILALGRATSFAGRFPFALNGERDQVLTFHAEPVTTQNWIYESYLAFARNPFLFVASPEKPECPVHICRQFGSMWYWVPAEAGEAFLDLVLKTAMSPAASDATAPIGYWESKIICTEDITDKKDKYHTYRLQLHDKLPADQGTVQVLRSNGSREWLAVLTDPVADPNVDSSDKFLVQSAKPLDKMNGATVRFFADDHPNLTIKAAPAQKVQDTLESIRILLNKNGNNGT